MATPSSGWATAGSALLLATGLSALGTSPATAHAQNHTHGTGEPSADESSADEPSSAVESSPAGAVTEASAEQASPGNALTRVALVTGVLGLLAGVVALLRTRRPH